MGQWCESSDVANQDIVKIVSVPISTPFFTTYHCSKGSRERYRLLLLALRKSALVFIGWIGIICAVEVANINGRRLSFQLTCVFGG